MSNKSGRGHYTVTITVANARDDWGPEEIEREIARVLFDNRVLSFGEVKAEQFAGVLTGPSVEG